MAHLANDELERRLKALAPAPKDEGRVVQVVVRPNIDERVTPERCRLSPESGLEGDRWSTRGPRSPENQVTMMWADAAEVFADGQPIALAGDNLQVRLDLSAENLPAGTRLRIGDAVCEVTPLPHTGCGKFERRFGVEARRLTLSPAWENWRLRGIHVRVIEAGDVRQGDPIHVLSRPDA